MGSVLTALTLAAGGVFAFCQDQQASSLSPESALKVSQVKKSYSAAQKAKKAVPVTAMKASSSKKAAEPLKKTCPAKLIFKKMGY
ncbi:hypothetical protein lacNasYZ02_14630 [Lactobacillus nasalidis]|nr:hypothetical protein lacNasYZ01_08190 [Lactobacillus nasalidis]GHW00034.1 hypothetical protein lacNasYZ02_14630 [Lactobacillus nasalidis]